MPYGPTTIFRAYDGGHGGARCARNRNCLGLLQAAPRRWQLAAATHEARHD